MKSAFPSNRRTPSSSFSASGLSLTLQKATRCEASRLLAASEAAACLGIAVTTLYDWLGRSKLGELMIRGQLVTIEYFQGGAQGQGRIQIAAAEVARLRDLMRVAPTRQHIRRPIQSARSFPGISVPLGLPNQQVR